MTTVRFGVACDGPGCKQVWNDYAIPEDVAECETCLLDLCPACVEKTGHVIVRKADEGRRAIVECSGGLVWSSCSRYGIDCPLELMRGQFLSEKTEQLCPDCRLKEERRIAREQAAFRQMALDATSLADERSDHSVTCPRCVNNEGLPTWERRALCDRYPL